MHRTVPLVRLAAQSHRLSIPLRQRIFERLLNETHRLPPEDMHILVQGLAWEIDASVVNGRNCHCSDLLAALRRQAESYRSHVALIFSRVLDFVPAAARAVMFEHVVAATCLVPPEQQTPVLAQLAITASSLPTHQQAPAFPELLEASAGLRPRRIVVALVRRHIGALEAAERRALQTRCDVLWDSAA